MPVFCLFVTFPSGYLSVRTFATAFERALEVILLSSQPLILRTQDY
jgi:hypothetical protein